jgi:exo-beta-1,3-glucanase (GH17 family)
MHRREVLRRLSVVAVAATAPGIFNLTEAFAREDKEDDKPDRSEKEGREPKAPHGHLPHALLKCRNWVTFAPPRPYNPAQNVFPTQAELRASLKQLYQEGWRGLVTYTMDGTLKHIPRLAKEVGFSKVIAGLFWYDAAQLARERKAAHEQLDWIDGFVLGNEGLQFGRYTRSQLETELKRLKAETHRPVATTEPSGPYFQDPTLLTLGDWVFPNIHPWFANIRDIPQAVQFTVSQYQALQKLAPERPIIIKESWWPTGGGDPAANDANQVAFFQQLAKTPLKFIFGEAYDEEWKTDEGSQGPHWGYHTADRKPKPAIAALRPIYTRNY